MPDEKMTPTADNLLKGATDIHPGTVARGQSVVEILALTVRKELRQEYNLNLSEMYSIMDYVGELERTSEALRAENERLTSLKAMLVWFGKSSHVDCQSCEAVRERLKMQPLKMGVSDDPD